MILFTKLNIPKAVFSVQYRKRLTDQLNKGLRGTLTLVNSMAGSGKTTLVGDWLARENLPHVWYSLDDADNDLKCFLMHLVAGFQKLKADFGQNIESALSSSDNLLIRNVLIELINEINYFPAPVIIVLDDYQAITHQAVHDAVTFLIGHYHPKIRMVIISRNQLPIPTQKLKIRKQFTEISYEDIRFQSKEIQLLYKVNQNVKLTIEEAEIISKKTEGWIAAIQLLSQSENSDGGRILPGKISGKKIPIMQYLMEEVVKTISEPVLDFLKKTAILDRLCLSLCDHLDISFDDKTFSSSESIIRYLLKQNLFIIPLDDENTWFRYHHLFRDFLLSTGMENELKDEICCKASEWFEKQGAVEESIEYAFRCKTQDRALKLLEQQTRFSFRNHFSISGYRPLLQFKDRIDSKKLKRFPLLSSFLATNEIFSLVGRNYRLYIDIAKSHAEKASTYPIEAYIRVCEHLEVLMNSYISEITDQSMKEILSILGNEKDTILLQANCFIHAAASRNSYYRNGDITKAKNYMMIAKNLAKKNELVQVFQSSIASYAQLQAFNNQSDAALETLNEGFLYEKNQPSKKSRKAGIKSPGDPSLNLVASRLHYKRNELSEAKHYIDQCYNILTEKKTIPKSYYGFQFSMIEQAFGNTKIAMSVLQEAVEWRQENSGFFFVSPAPLFESFYICIHFLRQHPGLSWLEEASYSILKKFQNAVGTSQGPIKYLALYLEISWLEYLGKHHSAVSMAEEIIPRVDEDGGGFLLMLLYLLTARIKFNLNEKRQAIANLNKAMALIDKNNMIRVCIDAGLWVSLLLNQYNQWKASRKTVEAIRSEFGLGSKKAIFNQDQIVSESLDFIPMEPIRNKERVILDLLSRAMSYKEIANEMNYSFNTIQSYIRDIYGKLGVHSRQEAVNKAKALNIIDDSKVQPI